MCIYIYVYMTITVTAKWCSERLPGCPLFETHWPQSASKGHSWTRQNSDSDGVHQKTCSRHVMASHRASTDAGRVSSKSSSNAWFDDQVHCSHGTVQMWCKRWASSSLLSCMSDSPPVHYINWISLSALEALQLWSCLHRHPVEVFWHVQVKISPPNATAALSDAWQVTRKRKPAKSHSQH